MRLSLVAFMLSFTSHAAFAACPLAAPTYKDINEFIGKDGIPEFPINRCQPLRQQTLDLPHTAAKMEIVTLSCAQANQTLIVTISELLGPAPSKCMNKPEAQISYTWEIRSN